MTEKTMQPPISKHAQHLIDKADATNATRTFSARIITIMAPSEQQVKIINIIMRDEKITAGELAERLVVGLSSMNTQINRIFIRLGVHSKKGLVELYLKNPELRKEHGIESPK